MAIRRWLEGWTFKGRQARFERDVLREYSWIFEKYDARIIPTNRYRQVLDYVVATVAVGNLRFRFVRGMGYFHVTVAPAHMPHDSYHFGLAVELARDSEPISGFSRQYRMSEFRQLFESNIERLKVFFSEEEYGPARRDICVARAAYQAESEVVAHFKRDASLHKPKA
jgi:hypothetical protein